MPGGDPELLVDEVDPRDELGHRVLHLEARVHLEEVELVADEEALDRAGGRVADRARELERVRPRAARGGRRRPSARATPRSASGGGAGRSSRARRAGRRCRGRRRAPGSRRAAGPRSSARGRPLRSRRSAARRRAPRRAWPPARPGRTATRKPIPPPPPGGLDRDRVADPLRDARARRRASRRRRRCPGTTGIAEPPGRRRARARLLAHRLDRLRRGPDEDDAGLRARPRERRVLGEEAVARVERLAPASSAAAASTAGDVQVALARRAPGRSRRPRRRVDVDARPGRPRSRRRRRRCRARAGHGSRAPRPRPGSRPEPSRTRLSRARTWARPRRPDRRPRRARGSRRPPLSASTGISSFIDSRIADHVVDRHVVALGNEYLPDVAGDGGADLAHVIVAGGSHCRSGVGSIDSHSHAFNQAFV